VLVDPALFFQGGGLEVNPDGLKARQLFQRLDFFLEQAPIGKGKDVEHGKGWRRSPGFEGIEGMAAFEPLAARPVQANPLREEIRKLPTGVGFQGVRSIFVQLWIMSSKCEIFGLGAALSRVILSRRNILRVGKKKQGF
jgi:hypothetical protein